MYLNALNRDQIEGKPRQGFVVSFLFVAEDGDDQIAIVSLAFINNNTISSVKCIES